MLGHYRPASEMPFECRFAGGRMMAAYNGIRILSSTKKTPKNTVKVGPPLRKLSGSTHESLHCLHEKNLRP